MLASLTYRWQQRMGEYVRYDEEKLPDGTVQTRSRTTSYRPYGLLSLKLNWQGKGYTLYLEGNNLTNHRYYDIGNVRQPGFWLMAGGKIQLRL